MNAHVDYQKINCFRKILGKEIKEREAKSLLMDEIYCDDNFMKKYCWVNKEVLKWERKQ